MKVMLKSIFDKFGYSVLNKKSLVPVDLRGQVDNPLLAKYAARKHNFLINADFKKCIVNFQFSCERAGNNPLVNIVTNYINAGYVSYSESQLEDFYNSNMPKNVAEWFNLEGEMHDDLIQLSADSVVFPWEKATMIARKKYRENFTKYETRQRGKELGLKHGMGWFGPVSKERGELEVETLVKLTESIRQKGYLRGDGFEEDIISSILIRDQNFKFLIKDGTHRIAVLSALNYKSAPIRVMPTSIPAFIYRNEVDYWPGVKNGLYSRDQALKIFDTIFNRS